ncbi:Hsp70 family protein [Micromonospora sp. WMMD730]|uniref:Hsp70 family protein n=1 Tax=Micromonospora sp. WMMD730 TaxID=3404128 RepID=UPI003B94CE1D
MTRSVHREATSTWTLAVDVGDTTTAIGLPGETLVVQSRRAGDPLPLRSLTDRSTTRLGDRETSTERIVAEMLGRALQWVVDRQRGGPPTRTVLAHPGGWDDTDVARLRAAAASAGLPGGTTMPAPVAAVHAVLGPAFRGVAGVLDVGGRTTSAAVVRAGGEPRLLAAGAPQPIGGADLDDVVRELLGEHGAGTWPAAIAAAPWPWEVASRAREELSARTSVRVLEPGGGEPVLLGRAEFERLAAPLADEMIGCLTTVLDAAPSRLDAILLVGGTGRTPLLSDLITLRFGRSPLVDRHPDLVVARGLTAARRAQSTEDCDDDPYGLGDLGEHA